VRRAHRRRRDVSARAYDTVDELASRVARSLATHGVDARYLSDASLEMLRRAGVSTDELLRAASLDDASDPETARAAFAEWSKAFAAEVAPSMRAHGVEADALDARTEGMLAAAGIFPDWLRWYQSRLPKTGDVFDTFDTHETRVAVPARRVRGMTLLDEAESEFGKLQVLRVDADATGADAPFAGAVVLMREHTPDAVLSEYRASTPNGADASEYSRFVTTGGVFDLFAMLPPLVAGQPPGYPIGVVGLGAGTVARELAHFYPSHGKVRGNARRIVGWELDPAIVHLARAHFGLAELEVSGRLVVRVGDAFQEVRRAFAEGRLLAGIVVDVFDEKSRVLPELTRMDVWEDISRALAPGGARDRQPEHGQGRGRGPGRGDRRGGVRGDRVRERRGDALAQRRPRSVQRGGHHRAAADAAGVGPSGGAALRARAVQRGVVPGARAAGEDTRLDPRSLIRAPPGSGRAARARRGADSRRANRSL
jgi:hypothetical protein